MAIRCFERRSGKWVLKRTVWATNSYYGMSTRYRARFALPYPGTWKLVARAAATAKYAVTDSRARSLRAD